jgi:hypothetical protein
MKDEIIDKNEFIDLVGPRPNQPAPTEPRHGADEPQDIGPGPVAAPTAA